MHPVTLSATILLILHILVLAAIIVRVLLRPHRQAASRIAWIVVVMAVPMFGNWNWKQRLWNNAVAMFGPVL